ncbi:MAG: hypothetical protein HQ568_06275 [Calditrichaeota bacterium]|nr:hypothetical protein [Calditrichota bacterium]
MGYGKKWKVAKSSLELLIANADGKDDCFIEIWNSATNVIEDSGTELWLKQAGGWDDDIPEDPPAINPEV